MGEEVKFPGKQVELSGLTEYRNFRRVLTFMCSQPYNNALVFIKMLVKCVLIGHSTFM